MVEAFDVPPPGVGLKTVMFSKAPVATSAAEIAACNWLEETKVVVRGLPLNWIVEELTKFVPFTVRVNAAPPATVELGFKDVIDGAGLLTLKTVEPEGGDEPPPGAGLMTVTLAATPLTMSEAGTVTCSSLLEMKAAACLGDLDILDRVLPLNCTLEAGTNPVPVMVKVKSGLPAATEFGLRLVTAGIGLLTVKVKPEEVPPDADGLATVIVSTVPPRMSAAVIVACS